MKIIKTLFLLLICTNILYAQKPRMFNIGAVADFPISKRLYYNFGVGAEASVIINTANAKNFIFSFSALRYQFFKTNYDSDGMGGVVAVKKTITNPFLRLTIGKFITVKDKLFFNVQGGFGIGRAGEIQSSVIQPTFLIGPTVILPIKETYRLKLNSYVGSFAGGFFVNVGAAFGFK
jgi:hypothetical protein